MTPAAPPARVRLNRRVGLVTPFTIADVVTGQPVLTGTVKVLAGWELTDFFQNRFPELEAKGGGNRHKAMCHLYAECVQAWDYFAAEGDESPLPVTAETLAELPEEWTDQLLRVIKGTGLGNGSVGG